ncbi:MAG UNVERIFIED_CONTAM: hypothetical protein LVR18_15655 [Planctomycetaceae bacterium]
MKFRDRGNFGFPSDRGCWDVTAYPLHYRRAKSPLATPHTITKFAFRYYIYLKTCPRPLEIESARAVREITQWQIVCWKAKWLWSPGQVADWDAVSPNIWRHSAVVWACMA